MNRTIIYTSDLCFEHRPGPHHPESPERLTTVRRALKAPEFKDVPWRDAPLGTREQILYVHTEEFVSRVERLRPQTGYVPLDGGDTVMSPGSWDGMMACIGAAIAAVDAVVDKEADNVFCATRPCGHHAVPDRAMGFCIFNQVAIAAVHAHEVRNLPRVAVVDIDVHHGNGTQDAFYYRPEMFVGSCHQSPFYPGTGAQHETGGSNNIVNIPLPRGCNSATFRSRMEAEMFPRLRKFAPSLIIISAGFDAHQKDPIGGLNFTDDDYYWVTRELMKIADETAEGRVISVMEGGYSMDALSTAVPAHVRALMGV